jgi:hypothetical protein
LKLSCVIFNWISNDKKILKVKLSLTSQMDKFSNCLH